MQNSDENVIHLSLTAISSLIMVIYRLFSTVATIMCCSSVFKSLLFAKHRFNFEAAIFGKCLFHLSESAWSILAWLRCLYGVLFILFGALNQS